MNIWRISERYDGPDSNLRIHIVSGEFGTPNYRVFAIVPSPMIWVHDDRSVMLRRSQTILSAINTELPKCEAVADKAIHWIQNNGQRLDTHGIMIGVPRDACDDIIAEITRLRAREADLLARAEQAEFGAAEDARKIEAMAARVAWLERPVTDQELFTAEQECWRHSPATVKKALTAALQIRMEPQK